MGKPEIVRWKYRNPVLTLHKLFWENYINKGFLPYFACINSFPFFNYHRHINVFIMFLRKPFNIQMDSMFAHVHVCRQPVPEDNSCSVGGFCRAAMSCCHTLFTGGRKWTHNYEHFKLSLSHKLYYVTNGNQIATVTSILIG